MILKHFCLPFYLKAFLLFLQILIIFQKSPKIQSNIQKKKKEITKQNYNTYKDKIIKVEPQANTKSQRHKPLQKPKTYAFSSLTSSLPNPEKPPKNHPNP